MFNTLYFLDHTNYYDRKVAINWTLGLYSENVLQTVQGVNFNPNDGVDTEITVNISDLDAPNYVVVLDSNNDIVSRWFIIDSKRIRGGQYKMLLHRDVIADYWNIIQQSPCLIEKCSLRKDDPLIFNSENMTFNQIKTSEVLLKDRSNCAWLVAYIAKNAKAEQLQGTVQNNDVEDIEILSYNEWSEFEDYQTNPFYGPATTGYEYRINFTTYSAGPGYYTIDSNRNISYIPQSNVRDTTLRINLNMTNNEREKGMLNGFSTERMRTMDTLTPSWITQIHSQSELNQLLELSGKYVKDEIGKVYLASIVKQTSNKTLSASVTAGSLYQEMVTAVNNSVYKDDKAFQGNPNTSTFSVSASVPEYKLYLQEIQQYETTYNLANADRLITTDAEYNIIAVPYGEITVKDINNNTVATTTAEQGMNFITSLQQGETPLVVYDIQLLPYCPIQNNITDIGEITVSSTAQYSLIKKGAGTKNEETKGIVFFVPQATLKSIYIIDYGFIPRSTSNITRKLNNECDKWRLCSPNYANYFDFSAEKNNGVYAYKVDCTYKPYSPYIHICPLFNNLLYGADFDDPRGLVCGGDFSLTQVNDAWQSYQLQNKNYQQTFDRQIQNMEVSNKYQRVSEITGAIAGVGQGAATGAFLGGGVGAVVGGILSAGAGAVDIGINEALRNETMDYTKDMFGYNLGNVQALPLTLTKVSAFNANNKIFPVLEYYTCTDREKEALLNKMAFNGMTTMVIDTIENNLGNNWEYIINDKTITSKNYIKAKPIHLNFPEDYHVAKTIAKELDMGFYIVQED